MAISFLSSCSICTADFGPNVSISFSVRGSELMQESSGWYFNSKSLGIQGRHPLVICQRNPYPVTTSMSSSKLSICSLGNFHSSMSNGSAIGNEVQSGGAVFPSQFKPVKQGIRDKQLNKLFSSKATESYTSNREKPSAFSAGKKFDLEDVIEAQQFNREILSAIFEVAEQMEKIEKDPAGGQILRGYLMATLFYEPSTRTRLSFESAMKRLGGEVLTTENAREFSSVAKGETLEDTIRTVEGYSDIIVMRHFESGAARQAATAAKIPIINAGDGPGQHPTQALLDVYTIQREIGRLDDIKVGLVGDLANGRTVRSLAYLLAKYNKVKIYFVAPDVVKMKDDIKDYLTAKGIDWEESRDLMEVASKCDVVYQTRIQRERFGERIDLYNEAHGKYIIDKNVMNALQKHAVIMHPLPRLDEITTDVDSDPRAAYFRQAKNGLYIRMALLKLLLLGW
ncbi:aspartate carbamoyltransferase, chloroplastic isoform X2 [Cryptomeria japonica]|uniref:aspartate carbamoyltransferase, chloroplastic isoform X2 n=1 Tax=Cryptomeria japonica TaxID=3369 RepID=UPI0025ABD0FB|nr:aspartate carbamoyltransferase, chloroplastic isoform X2 [Cryptomeria japonica]XP_057818626.1 aspartate carbamoyltransferase, chloroplastic isoform X2 [Cryptomeria japonica]XP_057818627.1 aspartate carbamoyltransferase, chloroplastic isoform X2 [Cryptomeria japonica]